MPRSGGGVYSAPAGTTATTRTAIESAKYNAFVADLVADANAARPIVAGGTGASTAAAALVNLGLTATAAELNYTDGVTSAIQTQLNAKQGLDATLTALAALNTTAGFVAQTGTDTFTKRLIAGDGNSITVTNGDGVAGFPLIEAVLASQAEGVAGTNAVKLMTPLTVKQALNASGSAPTYACRAWVRFAGTGTVAIAASGNVSSITDNGVGDYTVNFTTAISDANYGFALSVGGSTGIGAVVAHPTVAPTASALRILTKTDSGGSDIDVARVSVAIFR